MRPRHGEHFGKIHHHRADAQFGEDPGLEKTRTSSPPILDAVERLLRSEAFMAIDVPANELHAEGIVEVAGLLEATAEIQPRITFPRRGIAAHDVAHELEGGVLAGLVGGARHVAIDDARNRGIEGLSGRHDR
ncbi:MAG: hypothetical protein Q8L54_02190 [Devosia sp.]|nr:hypothetical protein [Devosia sp.]